LCRKTVKAFSNNNLLKHPHMFETPEQRMNLQDDVEVLEQHTKRRVRISRHAIRSNIEAGIQAGGTANPSTITCWEGAYP
jgi:hypothetical protein